MSAYILQYREFAFLRKVALLVLLQVSEYNQFHIHHFGILGFELYPLRSVVVSEYNNLRILSFLLLLLLEIQMMPRQTFLWVIFAIHHCKVFDILPCLFLNQQQKKSLIPRCHLFPTLRSLDNCLISTLWLYFRQSNLVTRHYRFLHCDLTSKQDLFLHHMTHDPYRI